MAKTGKILHVPALCKCPEITLGEYIFESLQKFSDQICQIDASTDAKETYKSVKERSVRVALALLSRGVTSSDVISICSENTLDVTIPIYASLFLGAAVANLSPKLTLERATHLLKSVEPKIVFVQDTALPLIEAALDKLDIKPEIVVIGKSTKYANLRELQRIQKDESHFKPVKVDVRKQVAIIFFTSGTTGLPKPIGHSSYSFMSILCTGERDLSCNGKPVLQLSATYWMSGVRSIIECAGIGCTRVILSKPIENWQLIYKVVEKYQIARFVMIATAVTCELTSVKNHQDYDTSSVIRFATGGNSISHKQVELLENIFQNAQISILYGSSEAGYLLYFNSDKALPNHLSKIEAGTCGLLEPGITLKIVDETTGIALGPNERGEICVKSDCSMLGYYKIDSSTSFDQNGFFKTGDAGYFDEDGYVHVVDRISEMFKFSTTFVAPAAIENVLQSHPAVKESVVFPMPDLVFGWKPTAWVVLKEGWNASGREIEEFVAERVTDVEKLRGGVSIVQSIPRTPTGKVMRRQVRDIAMKSMENNK